MSEPLDLDAITACGRDLPTMLALIERVRRAEEALGEIAYLATEDTRSAERRMRAVATSARGALDPKRAP